MQNNTDFFLCASRICFAFAAGTLLIALILFFLFDIRTILMIRTGWARQKAVDKMCRRNDRTGIKREADPGYTVRLAEMETAPHPARKIRERILHHICM